MEAAGADVVRVTSRSVIAALVLLAIAAASAQSPPAGSVRFTKRQLFVNPYESCTVGDLNRDGHPDIVYGAYWFAGPDFVPRTPKMWALVKSAAEQARAALAAKVA